MTSNEIEFPSWRESKIKSDKQLFAVFFLVLLNTYGDKKWNYMVLLCRCTEPCNKAHKKHFQVKSYWLQNTHCANIDFTRVSFSHLLPHSIWSLASVRNFKYTHSEKTMQIRCFYFRMILRKSFVSAKKTNTFCVCIFVRRNRSDPILVRNNKKFR